MSALGLEYPVRTPTLLQPPCYASRTTHTPQRIPQQSYLGAKGHPSDANLCHHTFDGVFDGAFDGVCFDDAFDGV